MGFKYTDAAFETRQVRGMDKYVLMLLAHRADNNTGVCWPSMRTIAEDGGIGKNTVCRSVKALAELGLVEVVSPGHERKSSRYRVCLEKLCPQSGTDCTQLGTDSSPELCTQLDTQRTQSGTDCTQLDTQRSAVGTEPVIEPAMNNINQPAIAPGGPRKNQRQNQPGVWDFSLVDPINGALWGKFVDLVNPKRDDGTRGKWQPEGYGIKQRLLKQDAEAHALSAAIRYTLANASGPVSFAEFEAAVQAALAGYLRLQAQGASQ